MGPVALADIYGLFEEAIVELNDAIEKFMK